MSIKVPIRIQFVNARETRRLMATFGSEMPRIMAGSLFRRGEEIMTASKQVVPHREGTLQDSGHVEPPRDLKNPRPVITLGYGGPGIPYAVVQHENLHFQHRPGRQAKYLEEPAARMAPDIGPRIGRDIFEELSKLSAKSGARKGA